MESVDGEAADCEKAGQRGPAGSGEAPGAADGGSPCNAEGDAAASAEDFFENFIRVKADALDEQRTELKSRRQALAKAKKDLTKEMRNQRRRQSRLKRKARDLHSGDLLELLAMKASGVAAAKAKAKAGSEGAGAASEAEGGGGEGRGAQSPLKG